MTLYETKDKSTHLSGQTGWPGGSCLSMPSGICCHTACRTGTENCPGCGSGASHPGEIKSTQQRR